MGTTAVRSVRVETRASVASIGVVCTSAVRGRVASTIGSSIELGLIRVVAKAAAKRSVGFLVSGAGGESCLVWIVIIDGVGALVLPVDGIVARQDAIGIEVLQGGPGDGSAQCPE